MSNGLLKKFASVGSATMTSRMLGFVRESIVALILGTGPVADVFYTCFRFPNLFRRLFAEGAFNIVFIPLFSKEVEKRGPKAAQLFANEIFSVLTTWLFIITIVAIIFMPFLVTHLVAPGFNKWPHKLDLSITMTRIMFPYLFCMSLVAMFSGILNALRYYFLTAAVPILLNIILIVILTYALVFDLEMKTTGLAMAWGVFVSGFTQLFILALALYREGMGLRFSLPRLTPSVKRFLGSMGPGLLTGGVLQINLMIGTIIATGQDGGTALLNFADRINQFPLGVIGVAVGVVLLPELSRALQAGDQNEVENLQNRSLQFVWALTLPATVGLILLPDEIVSLLYERGAFNSIDREKTALALAAFASGLPAYVMLKVFQSASFAREDMKTPFVYSVVMVFSNVVFSLALFPHLGHVAVALATSMSAWINCVFLSGTLWYRGHFKPNRITLRRLVVLFFSTFVMIHPVIACRNGMEDWFLGSKISFQLLAISVTIITAMTSFLGVAFLLGGLDRYQFNVLFKKR
ncbi:murein biosynthesis integral membrane protein MurJ [Candidatus Endowatersipora endosymbiont of Watersipora subatra]|uniref:murein biosynthesis integral membrane protein MurJ n=1 Tax=Candidatus Endowatersipora endosymbiont of Watersipora subatra TaxID=3077946 RepID=UPI00312C9EC3